MKKISAILILLLMCSCNYDNKKEFEQIDRNDIAGYELFIMKYPNSPFVEDAKERISAIKRCKEMIAEQAERQRFLNNSLATGSKPYSEWYGNGFYFDDYTPHSQIKVKAPYNSDVIVIVRYNNQNGMVAGHSYIQAGDESTIYLKNGNTYQTFFYYGKGWNPGKQMKNGVFGGFVSGEAFSKDGSPSYLKDNILKYELILSQDGNFSTQGSSENEIF